MTRSSEPIGNIPRWTQGDRLRKARESAGLEQSRLADVMGVSRSTVTNAEKGHHGVRKIVLNAWALATGVPVEWLETGYAPTAPDDPECPRQDSNLRPKRYQCASSPVRFASWQHNELSRVA